MYASVTAWRHANKLLFFVSPEFGGMLEAVLT